jgi:hypothetical protein
MPKLYKTLVDVSFPRPIRLRTANNGKEFWQSEGVSYCAGDTISEKDMLPRDAERASKGELPKLLELIQEPKKAPAKKPAAKAAAKPKPTIVTAD